jgi:hypothetical protein
MGMYIYRVSAKLVKLVDGRKAHVCQYAYKPYTDWSSEKHNARMHFKTGCVASEKLKLKSDLLVVLDTHGHEGNLYRNPQGLRTFYDDCTFGTEHMPKLGTVQRASQFSQFYKVTPKAEVVA